MHSLGVKAPKLLTHFKSKNQRTFILYYITISYKQISKINASLLVVHYNEASTTHTVSYKHLSDYALLGTRMLSFYESLDDKTTKYAEGILEGGSYNIMKAFRKLPLLKSRSNVCGFYDRFDALYDRKQLLSYREPANYWTKWTRFCLKHRMLATWFIALIISFPNMKTK